MYLSELFEPELDEGPRDPHIFKAIYLIGGPGSGKSYIGSKLTKGTGLKYVNLDTFFEMFAKKLDVSPSDLMLQNPGLHKKSGELAARKQSLHMNERLGLVIDGTGRNLQRILASKEILDTYGYDTMALFINTSIETALKRNAERNRKVDPEFLKRAHKEVRANLGAFHDNFDKFVIIDNNHDDVDLTKAWKRIRAFIDAPVSFKAKQWIDAHK